MNTSQRILWPGRFVIGLLWFALPAVTIATETDIGAPPPIVLGDYNHDGTVESGDYVIWRKTNFNGQQGYTDWRSNFGRSSGAGSSLGGPLPEPTSAILLLIGTITVALFRRKR